MEVIQRPFIVIYHFIRINVLVLSHLLIEQHDISRALVGIVDRAVHEIDSVRDHKVCRALVPPGCGQIHAVQRSKADKAALGGEICGVCHMVLQQIILTRTGLHVLFDLTVHLGRSDGNDIELEVAVFLKCQVSLIDGILEHLGTVLGIPLVIMEILSCQDNEILLSPVNADLGKRKCCFVGLLFKCLERVVFFFRVGIHAADQNAQQHQCRQEQAQILFHNQSPQIL